MDDERLVSQLRQVAERLRPPPNRWRYGIQVNNIELLADLLELAAERISAENQQEQSDVVRD